MIINYLRVAIRNLYRNKLYSVVNIGGLAIGLAVCMTILLYVVHEHSYDRFHKDASKIYAVGVEEKMGDMSINTMAISYVVAPMIAQANPAVEGYVRMFGWYKTVEFELPSNPAVRYSEAKNFMFADSNFFNFFTYRLLRGNPSTVLLDPASVVLSRSMAKKYFGDADPVGQTLLYNGKNLLKVTGICADAPSNSSLSFSFIAPLSLIARTADSSMLRMNWFGGGNFWTFLKLKDTAARARVIGTAQNLAAMDKSEMAAGIKFNLSRITDLHLSNNVMGTGNSTRYLQIFSLVAGLILLLALVNYMSLATARAVTRAREVGVRKAIGADRKSIAAQFYTESALYALFAFGTGVILFVLFRHAFFTMLGMQIDQSFSTRPAVLWTFAGLLVLTIGIAGSYPSLVLSAYNPVVVLYGKLSRQRGGVIVRKGFTVLQFSISIGLIICSLFILKQLQYMRHMDTGVDRDNVVMINCKASMRAYPSFQKEVQALPAVQKTATANYRFYNGFSMMPFRIGPQKKELAMSFMIVDTAFIQLLGLEWKEKPVSMADIMDGKHPVLNQAAVAQIGYRNPVTGQDLDERNIIGGVVKDFNYSSLSSGIKPAALFIGRDTLAFGKPSDNILFVRLRAHSDVAAVLAKIKELYDSFDKSSIFSYQFLDEAYDLQYKEEDKLADLMSVFTVITVIIACLGLLALATFAAQQRTREIGIRKVLGASVGSIASKLSADFLKPVGLSLLLAIPAAGWVMHSWLNGYAFRTSLSWWVFLVAAGLMGLAALATVFFLSLKAARTNPAESLRAE